MKNNLFMVFDVESVGLHGEGFSVGYCVVNSNRTKFENPFVTSGILACRPEVAIGIEKNYQWVKQNCEVVNYDYTSPLGVRTAFWDQWMKWRGMGALLVADCAWPVEANFLIKCVQDDPVSREFNGPYPLHELASILLAKGLDPMATTPRLEDELPIHNPLNDAKHSARQLMEALRL